MKNVTATKVIAKIVSDTKQISNKLDDIRTRMQNWCVMSKGLRGDELCEVLYAMHGACENTHGLNSKLFLAYIKECAQNITITTSKKDGLIIKPKFKTELETQKLVTAGDWWMFEPTINEAAFDLAKRLKSACKTATEKKISEADQIAALQMQIAAIKNKG